MTVDDNQLTTLGGDATIKGDLTLGGQDIIATTTTDSANVFATTTGKTTLGGGSVDVGAAASATTIKGTLAVNQAADFVETLTVANDKLTTLGGNAMIKGDLTLGGQDIIATTTTDSANVFATTTGTTTLGGGAVDVGADGSATTIKGTLTVNQAADFVETLTVADDKLTTLGGDATIKGDLTLGGQDIKATTTSDPANVFATTTGTTTLGGGAVDIGADGSATTIKGTLILDKATTLKDGANIIPETHMGMNIGSDTHRINHIYAEDMTVSNQTINFGPAGSTTGSISMTGGKLQVADSAGVSIDTIGLIDGKLHNLDISGNMSLIHGDVSFNNDLRVGKHVIVDGSLNVADNLTVDGITQFNNSVAVADGKTMTVGDGATVLGGKLTVVGDASFNNNVEVVDGKTMTVGDGATALGGTLSVAGATTLNNTVEISGTNTFAVGTGATTMAGKLSVANDASFNNVFIADTKGLTVGTGATTLGGTLDITGKTTIDGDLSANANLSIAGDVSMNKGLYVAKDVRIDGNLTVYSNDAVINTTTTDYQLIVAEDLSLNGRLFVLEDASFNKKLYAQSITDGTATLNAGALSGATTITASAAITGGSITDGTATLNAGALSGATTITASAAITGGSITDETATLQSGSLTGAVNVVASGDISANQLSDGTAKLTGGALSDATSIGAQSAALSANTPSTNTATGALTVVGGVGIGGDLYVAGDLSWNPTSSIADNSIPSSAIIGGVGSNDFSEAVTMSDTLTVTGDVSFNSNVIVGGNILPDATDTIDIGSTTKRINHIYTKDITVSESTINFVDANDTTLGSISMAAGGKLNISDGAGNAAVSNALEVVEDGSSGNKYLHNLDISGNLDVHGMLPGTTEIVNINITASATEQTWDTLGSTISCTYANKFMPRAAISANGDYILRRDGTTLKYRNIETEAEVDITTINTDSYSYQLNDDGDIALVPQEDNNSTTTHEVWEKQSDNTWSKKYEFSAGVSTMSYDGTVICSSARNPSTAKFDSFDMHKRTNGTWNTNGTITHTTNLYMWPAVNKNGTHVALGDAGSQLVHCYKNTSSDAWSTSTYTDLGSLNPNNDDDGQAQQHSLAFCDEGTYLAVAMFKSATTVDLHVHDTTTMNSAKIIQQSGTNIYFGRSLSFRGSVAEGYTLAAVSSIFRSTVGVGTVYKIYTGATVSELTLSKDGSIGTQSTSGVHYSCISICGGRHRALVGSNSDGYIQALSLPISQYSATYKDALTSMFNVNKDKVSSFIDVSFNKNLYVDGAITWKDSTSIADNSIPQSAIIGSNSFVGRVDMDGDVSMNKTLTVDGDVSFNQNLYVAGDLSWNPASSIADNSIPPSAIIGGVGSNSFVGRVDMDGDVSMNKTLTVDGDVSFNSNVIVGGNILPDATDTIDIGSTTKRINHIYTKDITVSESTINFVDANDTTLGSISMAAGGKLNISDGAGNAAVSNALEVVEDGSSGNKYLHNLDISGNLTINAAFPSTIISGVNISVAHTAQTWAAHGGTLDSNHDTTIDALNRTAISADGLFMLRRDGSKLMYRNIETEAEVQITSACTTYQMNDDGDTVLVAVNSMSAAGDHEVWEKQANDTWSKVYTIATTTTATMSYDGTVICSFNGPTTAVVMHKKTNGTWATNGTITLPSYTDRDWAPAINANGTRILCLVASGYNLWTFENNSANAWEHTSSSTGSYSSLTMNDAGQTISTAISDDGSYIAFGRWNTTNCPLQITPWPTGNNWATNTTISINTNNGQKQGKTVAFRGSTSTGFVAGVVGHQSNTYKIFASDGNPANLVQKINTTIGDANGSLVENSIAISGGLHKVLVSREQTSQLQLVSLDSSQYSYTYLDMAQPVFTANNNYVSSIVDVSFNKNLYVDGAITWKDSTSIADNSIPPSAIIGGVGSNHFVGDVSMNNDLLIVGDVSMNNGLEVVGGITAGTVSLTTSQVANSTTSGTLQVDGGVGITGSLYVGSDLYIGSDLSWNPTKIADDSIPSSAIIGGVGSNDLVGDVSITGGDLSMNQFIKQF